MADFANNSFIFNQDYNQSWLSWMKIDYVPSIINQFYWTLSLFTTLIKVGTGKYPDSIRRLACELLTPSIAIMPEIEEWINVEEITIRDNNACSKVLSLKL